MIKLTGNGINIESDSEAGECYIVWKPVVIGAGKTAEEALEDLRKAAHAVVNRIINLKLKEINEED